MMLAAALLHDCVDSGAPTNAPFVIYTDEQGQVFSYVYKPGSSIKFLSNDSFTHLYVQS